MLLLGSNCRNKPAAGELTGNYKMLGGRWTDNKDQLHEVIFEEKKWIDLYAGDTVSVNPFLLFTEHPDKGGVQSDQGKFLRLEESKDHFYWMIIEYLDSLRLRLDFISAGSRYELRRKN